MGLPREESSWEGGTRSWRWERRSARAMAGVLRSQGEKESRQQSFHWFVCLFQGMEAKRSWRFLFPSTAAIL